MAIIDARLLGVRPRIAGDLDAGVTETHRGLGHVGEQVRVDQARGHGVGTVFDPRGAVAACGQVKSVHTCSSFWPVSTSNPFGHLYVNRPKHIQPEAGRIMLLRLLMILLYFAGID